MTDKPADDSVVNNPTSPTNDQPVDDWALSAPSGWNASAQAWAPPPSQAPPTSTEIATAEAMTGQQSATAGWPSPRVEEETVAVSEIPSHESQLDNHVETVEVNQNPALIEAIQRADQLLDELRTTVATIGRTQAPDLSGVISELEVALTPPAALQSEDLAALRETLHNASEHPRDIDTILNLTGKLGSMSALLIAYDRSIAAIERSLDTLRGSESNDRPTWEP